MGTGSQQGRPVESPQPHLPGLGRKDVTLRKLDIKVETVNREPLTMHSDREDDTASISTATRVMKAIYSVRMMLLSLWPRLFIVLWPASPVFNNFHYLFFLCEFNLFLLPQFLCTKLLSNSRTHTCTYTGSLVHAYLYRLSHTYAQLLSPPAQLPLPYPSVDSFGSTFSLLS